MSNLRIQFFGASLTRETHMGILSELQRIQRRLGAHRGSRVSLFSEPNARWSDVSRAIDQNDPHIVHFSAHGTQLSRLCMLNEADRGIEIPRQAMQQMFTNLKGNIQLVVLSACYSKEQAEEIAKIVGCAIGLSGELPEEAALAYSPEFYAALADGKSVGRAHREALAQALPYASKDQCLDIIPGPGVNGDALFPGSITKGKGSRAIQWARAEPAGKVPRTKAEAVGNWKSESPWNTEKRRAFERNREKYGVWAEEFSVTKRCFADGSSVLVYEISGLRIKEGVEDLFFAGEAPAGVICSPRIDARGEDIGVEWRPESRPDAETMQEQIDQVGRVEGFMHLGQTAKDDDPDKAPTVYSFGWSVSVLNSESTNLWEYNNLYDTEEQRHIDGAKLEPGTEYFARQVWFPVRRLSIRLDLHNLQPPITIRPKMSCFELIDSPDVPAEEVVSGKTLWCFPNPRSSWRRAHGDYRRNEQIEFGEKSSVESPKPGVTSIAIDHPPLGCQFTVDWVVPKEADVPKRYDSYLRETGFIRQQLVGHRQNRLDGITGPLSAKISRLLLELHQTLYAMYGSSSSKEHFETALIVYDDDARRLLMVEGFVNDEGLIKGLSAFYLPYGLGVGGACFRQGQDAMFYSRSLDANNPNEPENYLRVPPEPPKECLIVLGIDHPMLDGEDWLNVGWPRARQTVGVVTVGSAYYGSSLRALCTPGRKVEISALRRQCQDVCNRISTTILSESGHLLSLAAARRD